MVKTQLRALAALACALGLTQARLPAPVAGRGPSLFSEVAEAAQAEEEGVAHGPAAEPAEEVPVVGVAEPCLKHPQPALVAGNAASIFPNVDPVCKYDFAKYCGMYLEPSVVDEASSSGSSSVADFYAATTEIMFAAARRLQVFPEESATDDAPAVSSRKAAFGRLKDRFRRAFRGDEVVLNTDTNEVVAGDAAPTHPRVNGHRFHHKRDEEHHSLARWHQHDSGDRTYFRHHGFHHDPHADHHGFHHGFHGAHHDRDRDHHHDHHHHNEQQHKRVHLRAQARHVAAPMPPRIAAFTAWRPIQDPFGTNVEGQMCMRAHLEELSPDCQLLVQNYDEQMKNDVSDLEDDYEEFEEYEEHHHSLVGAWISAVFWVALATWVCKRSKTRMLKYEQIRTVLDTVRDNADLKAAVETRTGVEVPKMRKLNKCCSNFCSGLIVFWASLVTLGAVCATGRHFAEEDPETGETLGWVMIGVVSTLIVVLGAAFARRAFCSSGERPQWGHVYNSNPGYIALTGIGAPPSAPGNDDGPEVYTGVPVPPPRGAPMSAHAYNPPNVI